MYNTRTAEVVTKLKVELDSLLPFKPEDEKRLRRKLRLEFNYNSNHLEGNTLTYGQTQLLLLYDKSSGDASVSDIEEMKAHDFALTQVEAMAKESERPLTETFIKELNQTILVRPFWKDAVTYDGQPARKEVKIGQYKTSPNSVVLKNGEIHAYATPEETPALMGDLLKWYNESKNSLPPVQLAAEFHYRLVCIHPFDDGNGRVARLVMNYILFSHSYPPVVIKSDDKESYLTALQKADTGNVQALIEYVEQQAIWSLELSIRAAKGEDVEEFGDVDKEIEIVKREKLTKATIYKTPSVAYDLVNHINNDLWRPLAKAIGKFDDFFVETKQEIFINKKLVEEPQGPGVIAVSLAAMFNTRSLLLGHDMKGAEVFEVEWKNEMYSLKTANHKQDVEVLRMLMLYDASYIVAVEAMLVDGDTLMKNAATLYRMDREYKSFFMSDEVEGIVKLVSKHLLEVIRHA